MDKKEQKFLKRLRDIFKVEAEEHINLLSSGLIELEKKPKSKKSLELIETIFREAHSLKGAARSVNRNDIESICQGLESTFAKVKNEGVSLTASQFDLIHHDIAAISKMISATAIKVPDGDREAIKQQQIITDADQPGKKTAEQTAPVKKPSGVKKPDAQSVNEASSAVELLIEKKPSKEVLQVDLPTEKGPVTAESVEQRSAQLETVRIPTAKLDPLFLQAEQMIQSKIAFAQRTTELKDIYNSIGLWKTELKKLEIQHPAVSAHRLKEMMNWTSEKLEETEKNIFTVTHAVASDQRSLGLMIDDHVESMKKVLMLPISTILEIFPRLVRDLARSQGKEVELIIEGEEIEVDKRILEELKDPLIHLVRNCIDHGIKKKEERIKAKKPPCGTVTLKFAVKDGRNLEVSISDDGTGINVNKVILAAIKSGVISKNNVEKLNEQESLALIFKSGITTSPMITNISGRGLGLAIVREKVEKLGGTVSVESQPNIGATFHLFLPLTLSTFRSVLVKTGEYFFFVPIANVERVLRVSNKEIKTVENRETIRIDQEIVSTIKLSDVLGLNIRTKIHSSPKGNTASSSDFIQLLVLTQGDKRICFKVDEISDEQQILVKELGKQLIRVRNISGATVLGSGKVVPVINVSDLMKSAMGSVATVRAKENEKHAEVKIYKILAVDDSITTRTLIKNILETAGYEVKTAVDGVDAFTKAFAGEFDLIVSDIDMPGMNGFELTAKIKKDKKLGELPVVLVTALESPEDREQGIDVGADAYIVKSSFDQSNLLEVIQKLL